MPHIVSGALKEYDWGVVDGLAPWHGRTGRPQAELWFGTHPAGPTPIIDGPDAGRLLADVDAHRGMPLVKLLAAGAPLSVQVHPDARAAERGRAERPALYADGAEKSEMLVALEPFEIHVGWRDFSAAAAVLHEAGADADVVERVREGDVISAAAALLRGDGSPEIARGIVAAAHEQEWPDADIGALARVAETFPSDPGIAVTALLDHDVLAPGDAVAVPAGVVHSYVGGLGVEVMTSSDNVLRLGLTSKPIAVDDALAAVRMDRRAERLAGGIGTVLAPRGMPFDLVIVEGPWDLAAGRHRLALAWQGDLVIASGAGAGMRVPQGRAAVWSPAEGHATVEPDGRAVLVTAAP